MEMFSTLFSQLLQFEGFIASLFVFVIVWFVIAILFCIWVYQDAESRGMSGVLWLIVVLLIGLVGLIIYLVVRKEKQSEAPPPAPPPPPPP